MQVSAACSNLTVYCSFENGHNHSHSGMMFNI